jgi:vacuolar-type H+-ATPase subunit E/Vma4
MTTDTAQGTTVPTPVGGTADHPSTTPELEPVRQALLADAAAQADALVAAATREVEASIAEVQQRCDQQVAEVEQRSARASRASLDQEVANARAEAHGAVLGARARAHDRLVEAARAAAMDMRHDPRYPALLDHFERIAHEQLGDDATIERDPTSGGGIVATLGSRRVDYSLPQLADRALEVLADEVARSWT